MNRYFLLTMLLTLAHTASADQLDGLENLDVLLIVGLIGAISIIVLVFSLLRTIINRLAKEKFKVSIGINLSCATLIICSIIAMAALGSRIDPGFLLTCIGIIVVSSLLIVLNYKVGSKRENNVENE
ncbi:MAG: hypothetical protein K9G40_06955 [Crocinitomicaceae bacterium]|nr:hypothetical protein [Crocinitomicaceae bacterium]